MSHSLGNAAHAASGRKRIAIVGGGISGLAAAYELARGNTDFTLFESSGRLGGIVETVRSQEFVIECGPDSWVTEKPWARELAVELGLEDQIITSNDRWRRTYLLQDREAFPKLVPIPDGMRMMVPAKWGSLLESSLLSWQARLAYLREPKRAAELKASAPRQDESVLDFVRRHFGDEVTETLAGPLLAAVFGGDIAILSVRAAMPAFVKMEAEHGSLIRAVQILAQQSAPRAGIFSSLKTGLQTLVDCIVARLPDESIQLRQPVLRLLPSQEGWRLTTPGGEHLFDSVVVAASLHATGELLRPLDRRMSELLPRHATSAVVVALAFALPQAARMRVPRGFGFIVPASARRAQAEGLLACTFVDQKFSHRAPEGAVLLRAFFGGETLLAESDSSLGELAHRQLSRILGPLPAATETVVRRWPQSLPQYAVGHLDRISELQSLVSRLRGLHLVGNAYYGVGLPDLISAGRAIARELTAGDIHA